MLRTRTPRGRWRRMRLPIQLVGTDRAWTRARHSNKGQLIRAPDGDSSVAIDRGPFRASGPVSLGRDRALLSVGLGTCPLDASIRHNCPKYIAYEHGSADAPGRLTRDNSGLLSRP